MSGIDRLGHQFFGAQCEKEGCIHSAEEGVNSDGSPKAFCYEHSVDRLVEALFVPQDDQQILHTWVTAPYMDRDEEIMGLITARQESTMSDLCTCNNLDHSDYNEECPLNGDEEEVEEMLDLMDRANELARLHHQARNPPGTTYDGRSYHRNINWEGLIESAREEASSSPPLDPPGSLESHAIDEEQVGSFMRAVLGIPPMRRDEGEETE